AERGGRRLDVELAGLREVGLLVEVIDLAEAGAALADRAGQDRGIDTREAALVEEVGDRLLDLIAHTHDGALLLRPQPEVTMIEQEVDTVLFRLDRVFGARADDDHVVDRDLIAAGRARVRTHRTGHVYAGFLRQRLEACPDVCADLL